ncbi:MAG: glycosyltransferase family 4 protein [Balneolaceae bacterium]|nr:glycosyltransferase family 4 protein [Balneolaceae bacterium]
MHLLGKKFINPHDYDMSVFEKIEISQSYGFLNRVSNKLFNLNIFDIESCFRLIKLLKRNSYKAIHAHFGTNAVDILPFAKLFNIPLIVSFHGADASRMLDKEHYVAKLPALFEYAVAITISSRHMADNLKLDKWKEKVSLIPYGVNPSFFNVNSGKKEKGKIQILHAGRIVGKKGVPDLIKVFNELTQQYNNIELHVAGDGEELSQCQELVDKFELDSKVIFYGNVTHEKIKELMNEADIFVLNSRIDENGDMEGTPNTILEAMCMGKAVLSTRHAGIPYVIEHNKNGLLANEKSNQELKANLQRLINNPDLREELGVKARETILESYTIDVMKDKIKAVFKQV